MAEADSRVDAVYLFGSHAAGDVRPTSDVDFAVLLASYTVRSPHTIHPQACLSELVAFAAELRLSFDASISRHWETCASGSAAPPQARILA